MSRSLPTVKLVRVLRRLAPYGFLRLALAIVQGTLPLLGIWGLSLLTGVLTGQGEATVVGALAGYVGAAVLATSANRVLPGLQRLGHLRAKRSIDDAVATTMWGQASITGLLGLVGDEDPEGSPRAASSRLVGVVDAAAQLATCATTSILGLLILLRIDGAIACIVLLTSGLAAVMQALASARERRRHRSGAVDRGASDYWLQQVTSLPSALELRLTNAFRFARNRWLEGAQRAEVEERALLRSSVPWTAAIVTINAIGVCGAALRLVAGSAREAMSANDAVMAFGGIQQASASLQALVSGMIATASALSYAADAARFIGEDRAMPVAAPSPKPVSIEFDHVEFAYPGVGQTIFRDATLSIRAGEIVAVTGPNGAGKSTMLALVAGVLTPTAGRVAVDGVPLDAAAIHALRYRCRIVSPAIRGYRTTVREALSISRPVSDEALLLALQSVSPEGFKAMQPHPLDRSVTGESRTAVLSSGEWQRIQLSACFADPPDLLLLDEPTSHLDTATAARVSAQISSLKGRCTTIIATHSAAVVAIADRQFHIDHGMICAHTASALPMPHGRGDAYVAS